MTFGETQLSLHTHTHTHTHTFGKLLTRTTTQEETPLNVLRVLLFSSSLLLLFSEAKRAVVDQRSVLDRKTESKKKKKAKRENSERGHRSRTYACASAHLLLTVSKSDFARDTPARTVISPPQVAKFAFVVAVDSTAFAVSQQPR